MGKHSIRMEEHPHRPLGQLGKARILLRWSAETPNCPDQLPNSERLPSHVRLSGQATPPPPFSLRMNNKNSAGGYDMKAYSRCIHTKT